MYSWDITYLPTDVRGIFLYLYLVMDVYSRKIVGRQIHECESADLAADLMVDICEREDISKRQVPLHSDNGSPMKGAIMLATLQKLGVIPSFSRPAVTPNQRHLGDDIEILKNRYKVYLKAKSLNPKR